MPGNTNMAFLTRMPAGIPGALSRPDEATVEAQIMDSAAPATGFGQAVRLNNGKVAALVSSSTATDVYGFVVRTFPSISGLPGSAFADGAPNPAEPVPVLVRGYMGVSCNAGTPAKGGQVYVRVQNPATGKPVGGVEAVADGANTVTVTNCIFTGPMDSNNLTEIRLWR